MAIPQNHVAQVATFLSTGSGTPQEKLGTGGKMLWAATVLAGDWTPELLVKARKALAALAQGNKIEVNVGRMDDATATKALKLFAKEVSDIAAEFAEAKNRRRAAGVH